MKQMSCIALVLVTTTLLATSACVSEPRVAETFQDNDFFFHDVAVVDVTSGSLDAGRTVVVRDGTILAIHSADEVDVPEAATSVSGGYLLPGLWDMHGHVVKSPAEAVERTLPLLASFGVTSVRDMGSTLEALQETRERLAAEPRLPAPNLYAAGPLLDGQRLPWYLDLQLVVKDPEAADETVAELVEGGVDFLKIYEGLSADVLTALAEAAAARDLDLAGHPPRSVGLSGAVEAGLTTVEHLSTFTLSECVENPDEWFQRLIGAKFGDDLSAYYELVQEFFESRDAEVCDNAYQRMADLGTWFTPTLVLELNDSSRLESGDLDLLAPSSVEWCETGLAKIDAANGEAREAAFSAFETELRRMRELGVGILAGSDFPNNCLVPGASLHWELERLVAAGLPAAEALAAATLHPAQALGVDDRHGRIAPGMAADALLLERNPLEDITATRDLQGVLHAGRWLDEAALETLRGEARAWEPPPGPESGAEAESSSETESDAEPEPTATD